MAVTGPNNTEALLSFDEILELEFGGCVTPINIHLRLVCVEYSKGFDTRIAVSKVLKWLAEHSDRQAQFLKEADAIAVEFKLLVEGADWTALKPLCGKFRKLMKELGLEAGVQIEPEEATDILDQLLLIDNVVWGVCPGAGGYDALALLVDGESKSLLKAIENIQKQLK